MPLVLHATSARHATLALHVSSVVRLLTLALGIIAAPLAAADQENTRLFRAGVEAFYAAKPAESVAAFDRLIAIQPELAPQLWQRGLSLYYAGDFAGGRKQFEIHQGANPQDVENAAWHFACVARVAGVDAARAALIPIAADRRIPMAEIHAVYAGTGSAAAVLAAAERAGDDATRRNQQCYAHLYLGLLDEVSGRTEPARDHLRKAAIDYRMEHYMGVVAQVHVRLRGWGD